MIHKRLQKSHPASQTPMVLLYFWFTASASLTFLIGAIYVICWWEPEIFDYHPIALYYLIGIPTIYVNSVPVADFYLCFDRCIAVAFPIQYQKYNYGMFFGLP
uniref:Uncharacterized protein n=1 Tax=Panagrolaimus sp. PS1159 TaxID=55785 RepID=A0AC35FKL0_9BILA